MRRPSRGTGQGSSEYLKCQLCHRAQSLQEAPGRRLTHALSFLPAYSSPSVHKLLRPCPSYKLRHPLRPPRSRNDPQLSLWQRQNCPTSTNPQITPQGQFAPPAEPWTVYDGDGRYGEGFEFGQHGAEGGEEGGDGGGGHGESFAEVGAGAEDIGVGRMEE